MFEWIVFAVLLYIIHRFKLDLEKYIEAEERIGLIEWIKRVLFGRDTQELLSLRAE
jgi:hypothetical protein